METRSERPSASTAAPSQPAKPDTSSASERLTSPEVESLQREKRDAIDWALEELARVPAKISLASDRLTNSELEALQRDLQESTAWLQSELAKKTA